MKHSLVLAPAGLAAQIAVHAGASPASCVVVRAEAVESWTNP
jgi:hypothetical protein